MRRVLIVVSMFLLGTLFVVPVTAQESSPEPLSGACATPTREEAAEVATNYLNIWNTNDVSQFVELAHPDIVHHWGQGVDTVGIDALKTSTEAFFTAFPDMVMTFDDTIVEGDMVVIRWTLNGTQTGEFFEIPPTGKEATWTGVNIYRVSCGKVVESWSEADGVGLRAQLIPSQDLATPVP